jgi:hypothetical protein
LWVIFALLDPDPDSESGSGPTDPIESGSNPDPDPQPCKKQLLLKVIFGKCDIIFHGIRIQTSWKMLDPDPYLYTENPTQLQPWQILYYT